MGLGWLARGDTVTFTSVAKAAGVSTWLVYAPGVREHIEAARTQQARAATKGEGARPANGTIDTRADVEVLRADNQRLRGEVHALKETAHRQLGRQLDQLQSTDLTTRNSELTEQNQELNSLLTRRQHEEQQLHGCSPRPTTTSLPPGQASSA